MPNGSIFAFILLIVAVIIFLVVKRKKEEGFNNENISHDEYVELSMKKYNPLADQYDVMRPNFAATDNPVELDKITQQIKNAMTTAEIYPDANTNSRFGVSPQPINISMPPSNQILLDSKKCEAIKGRSCSALNNSENKSCGICLKGGTAFSDKNSAGKHIGGLLVLPDDRAEAEAKAGANGVPAYVPTIGECAPGYLFVTADACEKGKNRLECAEAGEAGGFDGAMKDIARAKCAQVINGDMDKYVYEPRGRRFNVNLRVITPSGCGAIQVYVNRASNNESIGSYKADKSGFEFVIPVRNVGEAEEVKVKVLEEVPHRPRGRTEVFRYEGGKSGYVETIQTSKLTCERIGARQATSAELEVAHRKGMQMCGCANTTSTNAYPMQTNVTQYGVWGCGPGYGILQCSTNPNEWNKGRGASWCIGVKPPAAVSNMEYYSKVNPFFERVVAAEPENIWSEHGEDYQAPYYRAVIMQWESEDGKRSVPFEPSIVKVNGIGPSNIAPDGTMTFNNLRRLGTFMKSSMILSPRPGGAMIKNQFWIWNNQPNSQTAIFSSKIPGVFKDPFYREDLVVAPRGPLISTPETMKLMRTSPCLRDGELPGKYSIECLTSLFRSSGGDPLRGKLATENGGLIQLLSKGDMDAISEYLSTLYTTATKGRDSMGNRVGTNSVDRAKKINEAAQLMFGFDLSTPCEDIIEDAAGNMQIVAKSGPYKADCLDFLWMNTGNDRQRGDEDRSRNTSISNTYTSLWDRYSGLRSNEGSVDKRTKHPFQACQRNGSKAPINAEGKQNAAAISEANAKGNIQAIQNWYNQIHNNANFLPTSSQNNNAHKEFMKQCYGIDRVDYTPNDPDCGGVRARYVRILATGIHDVRLNYNFCIQIPHIEVFDSKNNEVARGKPTSSHSVGYDGSPEKAVTGAARPHTHYEEGGEYHDDCKSPDKQFWMVDLGSTVTISKVIFYPRTDCCTERQLQAPVQLLNESKQIVAQQPIGQTGAHRMREPQVITFAEAMTKPKYPISSLSAGMRLTFRSAIASDRFLHHGNFAIWATSKFGQYDIWSDVHRKISTWTLRPARNGVGGLFSFESIDWPNHFIRHSGFRCWMNTIGNGQVEKDDASFAIIPALNGDPTMVSIRSANYPEYYIATKREDPTEIWITKVDTSNVWDVQRASWTIMDPRA
jgi:hypothetical protein